MKGSVPMTVGFGDRSDILFFNDTAATEICTLSLHDALPIFDRLVRVAASNHRRSRVHHGHLLAAISTAAAGRGGLERTSRRAAYDSINSDVGNRADNRDNVAATVVGGRREIKGPGSAKFKRL